MAAAVNTRRYSGARRTRHCVSASLMAGMTSAYSGGSRMTTGSSQTAYTSFTTPADSLARLVSSTVAASQASKARNRPMFAASSRKAAAETAVQARYPQTTARMNARSCLDSDQKEPPVTRGKPWRSTALRA